MVIPCIAEKYINAYSISIDGLSFYGCFNFLDSLKTFAAHSHYVYIYIGVFKKVDGHKSEECIRRDNLINLCVNDMATNIANLFEKELICCKEITKNNILLSTLATIHNISKHSSFIGLAEEAIEITAHRYDPIRGFYVIDHDNLKNKTRSVE